MAGPYVINDFHLFEKNHTRQVYQRQELQNASFKGKLQVKTASWYSIIIKDKSG